MAPFFVYLKEKPIANSNLRSERLGPDYVFLVGPSSRSFFVVYLKEKPIAQIETIGRPTGENAG